MTTVVQHSPRRTRAQAQVTTAPTSTAVATAMSRTPPSTTANMTEEMMRRMMRELAELREERRRDREQYQEELRRRDEEMQQLLQLSRSNIDNDSGARREGIPSSQNVSARGNCKIKVDTYDGKGPLKEFLEQFDLVAQAYSWTDKEKVMMLATNLRGRARSILGSREKVIHLTFNELCAKLELRFGDKLQTRTYASLFANRKQKFDEELSAFGAEIERLAERAYPEFSLEMCDRIACDRFINGLTNDYVKQKLLEEDFTSLRDAMERAEALKQLEIRKGGRGYRSEKERIEEGRKFNRREYGKDKEKEKGETRKENGQSRRKEGNAKGKECWNCGSADHFRAECPSLSKKGN